MDLDSLRYVVMLAGILALRAGRAAALHSPAGFRAARKRLECRLGIRIFDRTSRLVTLTVEGAAFVARARQVLAMADELAEPVREEPPADGSVLRVGVLGFGLADSWPHVRELLAVEHPGLALEHVEMDWDSQYDAVRSGAVDVALAHDIGYEEGVRFDRIFEVGRVAVVPVRSAYADADRLTPADLDGEQWVRPVGRHPGWPTGRGRRSRAVAGASWCALRPRSRPPWRRPGS